MTNRNEYLFRIGDPNERGTSCDLDGPVYPICDEVLGRYGEEPLASNVGPLLMQRICWLSKLALSSQRSERVGLCILSGMNDSDVIERSREVLQQTETPAYILEEALKLRDRQDD